MAPGFGASTKFCVVGVPPVRGTHAVWLALPDAGPAGLVRLEEPVAFAIGAPLAGSVTVPASVPVPWHGMLPESPTVPSSPMNWNPAVVVVSDSLSAPGVLVMVLTTRESEPLIGSKVWLPVPTTNSDIPVADALPFAP